MLTGRRAFQGEDIADVLSRVLQREPDLAALPAATPPRLRELIARCLIKDARQRLRDIGDARLVLDGAFETERPVSTGAPATPARSRAMSVVAAAALLLAAGLGVPASRHLMETPSPEMRFELVTPPTSDPQSFALSPDGRQIVFVADERGGTPRLWLRSLGSTAAQPIAGTDEATLPFWSPDGRSVGFFAGGQLKRLDLASGATRVLAAAQAPSGGSWNADGVILFARAASPILRVSTDGGEPRPATTLGSQNTHRFPVFLPDGQHFLFYIRGGGPAAGVFLGALDGASQTRLTAADVAAASLPSGWVLWKSGGALLAQRLDLQGRALTGPQVTVADGLVGFAGVSASAAGLIAYRSVPGVERQLTWYNRAGQRLGTVGAPETGLSSELRLAPDGRRAATARSVAAGRSDIWLLDGSRSQRVTFDDAEDKWPVWAPDGERVAFSSSRTGGFTLYAKRTDATTPEQPLLPPGRIALANAWSHDGRFLLYASAAADGRYDLLVHPMVDGVQAGAVVQSAFNEAWARFSPDDRWIAYQSDESGQSEVYVRAFTAPGRETDSRPPNRQWQVSAGGGEVPVWAANGRELFYVRGDGMLMTVPITVRGAAIEPQPPVALFVAGVERGVVGTRAVTYDVASDGRFLINTIAGDAAAAPIAVIQHWSPPVRP